MSTGTSLQKVIESEFSGDLKKAMLALGTPIHEYFGNKLLHAFNRMNVDEKTITRVIITQRETSLSDISQFLNHSGKPKDRKPLAQYVSEKTSGHLKTFLNAVVANFVRSERG